MTPNPHLTEAERQALADGTLDADLRAAVLAHVAACAECSADVARLEALMTHIRRTPATDELHDDLWPGIRSRIEAAKVVPLDGVASRSSSGRWRRWSVAGVAAAALVVAVTLGVVVRSDRGALRSPSAAAPRDTTALSLVADSARAYEEEARTLMNELEMRRSMMRPQAAAAFDGDLRTIDRAIAELKEAIANDPNNPALRRLLASSYRQKVELLKRAATAG